MSTEPRLKIGITPRTEDLDAQEFSTPPQLGSEGDGFSPPCGGCGTCTGCKCGGCSGCKGCGKCKESR